MFPTVLPDNAWGALTLIVIAIGSLIANRIYAGGAKEQAKQNTVDQRSQVLLDLFTNEISDLKAEMANGFAERDKRISGLEKAMGRIRSKYNAALQHVRDLRNENPRTKVLVPAEIEPDL